MLPTAGAGIAVTVSVTLMVTFAEFGEETVTAPV
jgi:hypothetical protein